MTQSYGRQFKKIIPWRFLFRIFLVIVVMKLMEREAAFAAMNGALSGSIEGAYLYSDIDSNGTKSSTRGIEQRYNLRYSQNLIDSRLGYFSGAVGWADDQTTQSGPKEESRRYTLKDYNLNLSLFPRFSPLTLFAQKSERENQFDLTTHDTITTYGFAWLFTPIYLPRIAVNGTHTTYTSDRSGLFPTSETDVLSIDSGGRWRSFNVNARYLYNQSKDENGETNWGHGINLNLNGAVTRALTLGAYANYTNRGGTVQGFNFYQENALGLNLFYLPNRFWDGNLRFDFIESPGSLDFKRYLVSGGLNLHPTSKLDLFNSAQYTRFDTGNSRTDSIFANTGLNYRPFFGLTLTGGLGAGATKLTGGGVSSKNYFGQANWSANYFKVLPLLRVNAGYGGSISQNHNDTVGDSRDLTNTLSAGIDNTQTEIIHVGVNGTLTKIHRTVPSRSDDQNELRLTALADKQIRNMIFYNDFLILNGNLTYIDVSGFGVDGKTLSEELHGSYQFLTVFTLLGDLSHTEYPSGLYGNSLTAASVDFLGNIRPWINGLWTFSVKESVNDWKSAPAQKTFEGQTRLSHQLGRLTLSTDYQYLRNDIGSINSVSQQFLVRAIRSF